MPPTHRTPPRTREATVTNGPARPTHVLITGATGLLGTALLESWLRTSDAHISVLVRDADLPAAERLLATLRTSAFDALRTARTPLRERITLLPGSLRDIDPRTPRYLPLPTNIDLVIHAAADTHLEHPLGPLIEANVASTESLYRALAATGSTPHVIHISSAYTQAGRTALAYEGPVRHDLRWREEITHIAGKPDLACDPQAGRAYARREGWVDAYTYTKALGERVAEDLWAGAGHQLTIVRPSMLASAAAHPHPGWFRGTTALEPLIKAYIHGDIEEKPAPATATFDIVPVDAVVDIIRAAASLPGRPGRARYLHQSTSTTAPLRLDALLTHLDAALQAHGRPKEHTEPSDPAPTTRRQQFTEQLRKTGNELRNRLFGAPKPTRAGLATKLRHHETFGPYLDSSTAFNAAVTSVLLAEYRTNGGTAVDLHGFDWRTYFTTILVPALGRARGWWKTSTNTAPWPAQPNTNIRQAVTQQGQLARSVATVLDDTNPEVSRGEAAS
nr:SDR family oxidoreductase [Dermatophilus congolensis]